MGDIDKPARWGMFESRIQYAERLLPWAACVGDLRLDGG